jgi:hypothetical protein
MTGGRDGEEASCGMTRCNGLEAWCTLDIDPDVTDSRNHWLKRSATGPLDGQSGVGIVKNEQTSYSRNAGKLKLKLPIIKTRCATRAPLVACCTSLSQLFVADICSWSSSQQPVHLHRARASASILHYTSYAYTYKQLRLRDRRIVVVCDRSSRRG